MVFLDNLMVAYCSAVCRDEKGQTVDWYVVYKLPKLDSENSMIRTGVGYVYITNKDTKWVESEKSASDPNSLLGKTLARYYKESQRKKISFIMYNDVPPDEECEGSFYGHSKGVIIIEKKTGLWITHSIPAFPNRFTEGKYRFPKSAAKYGHMALCMSFNVEESADQIVKQFLYIKPLIYDIEIKKSLLREAEHLEKLIDEDWVKEPPYESQISIATPEGYEFISFAKSTEFDADLYGSLVAPNLKSDLLVASWRQGEDEKMLASNCSGSYKIENIDELELPLQKDEVDNWKYTADHSKWSITKESNKPFTCIGDINRVKSQFRRGGGIVCLGSQHVWKSFNDAIRRFEECHSSKPQSQPHSADAAAGASTGNKNNQL